jgi:gas vesicle protein
MADENSSSDKLIWFIAGAAVGAAVALLYAPKSGRETRRYLGEKASEGREYLAEAGRDVYDKGRDLYERGKGLAEDAADLFERGRKAVHL